MTGERDPVLLSLVADAQIGNKLARAALVPTIEAFTARMMTGLGWPVEVIAAHGDDVLSVMRAKAWELLPKFEAERAALFTFLYRPCVGAAQDFARANLRAAVLPHQAGEALHPYQDGDYLVTAQSEERDDVQRQQFAAETVSGLDQSDAWQREQASRRPGPDAYADEPPDPQVAAVVCRFWLVGAPQFARRFAPLGRDYVTFYSGAGTRGAVRGLDVHRAYVLQLQGMGERDIAARTGHNPGQVKNLLKLARQRMATMPGPLRDLPVFVANMARRFAGQTDEAARRLLGKLQAYTPKAGGGHMPSLAQFKGADSTGKRRGGRGGRKAPAGEQLGGYMERQRLARERQRMENVLAGLVLKRSDG